MWAILFNRTNSFFYSRVLRIDRHLNLHVILQTPCYIPQYGLPIYL